MTRNVKPDNMLIDVADLPEMYASGEIIGALIDNDLLGAESSTLRRKARREHDEVMRTLKYPRMTDADLSAIAGTGKDQLCTPWHCYLKSDVSSAMKGAQKTGDCVSWGIRGASDVTRCWEIWALKQPEVYVRRQATALIYSGRGHVGAGASPARLSDWHVKTGFLLETTIKDSAGTEWDFSDYAEYVKIGMKYGRNGLPQSVIDVTSKHRLQTTSLVEDMDQLADALWNGYGCHCGSGIGVSSKGDPVSRLRGAWAHDMAIVGFDDRPSTREKFGSRLWFWDQSWGNWNTVTGILPAWQPWGEGMFVLTEDSTWKAVRQQGTWCFSDADGFPARPFDNLLI